MTIATESIEDLQGVEDAIFQSFVEFLEKVGPEKGYKWCDVLEQMKVALESEEKTGY